MYVSETEDWSAFRPERIEALIRAAEIPQIGYLVWTRQDHGEREVRERIDALTARGIAHIRTGVSWAEWVDPEGREWITWYVREYARHFKVLPCLTFTPPSLGIEPRVNAPPKEVARYAQFVDDVLGTLGQFFDTVELWNEWNLDTDWDPALDPSYHAFTDMIVRAARVVRGHGKRALLGGTSKVNGETVATLATFSERGMRAGIDAVGIHNLRGTWSDHVPPPPLRTQARLVRNAWGRDVPVWLTEYGFPVADPEQRFDVHELELVQVALFAYMVHACLTGTFERAYWYTYRDEVHESLRFATTGWEDILQFYFGDTAEDGTPRLLADVLCEGGPLAVLRYAARENLMPLVLKASLGRQLPAA